MSRPPRAFSEPLEASYVGRIPRRLAQTWRCGELAFQSGEVLFMVDNPQAFPPAARPGIRIRNTALVKGACSSCGELVRPALAVAPGAQSARFPSDPHDASCPASEASIARILDESSTNAGEEGTLLP